MADKKNIVLVEDNKEAAAFLKVELEYEGYNVQHAKDGQQGLMLIRESNPDLVIMDWEMPNMTGVEVCRRLRQSSNVPVLMLTAKTTLQNKVEGLDSGANDYLLKPYELEELLARIRVLLRNNKPAPKTIYKFESLEINSQTCEVHLGDNLMELSKKEYELLFYLIQHPNQVLSKSQIYEKVWGWDSEGNENAVEIYIHNLRNKLEKFGDYNYIHTKRGMGYILKAK